MVSKQPRKQRANVYSLPLHKRRDLLSARLSKDLKEKYNIRSLPIRKGDRVKVLLGDFKKVEGEVLSVDTKRQLIEIQGLSVTKTDGSQVNRPVHPSNVVLLKIVEDKERLRMGEGRLKVG